MTGLYPLLLDPTLHVKVWGGRQLAQVLGKKLPTGEPYGESWEIYDTSVVSNGPLAGRTLGAVLSEYGPALVGSGNDKSKGFPLLVKFLDAADWLSVQVHPDDAQANALENEPRGKTEAWYVLAAAPGAQLVIGVKPGTNRDRMVQAIRETRLEELLVYADIAAGDALYMPAGTIHAIGPGALIYEIQQASDLTYRLYDWGRMGLDGQPRPLHLEKGVQVSNVNSLPQVTRPGDNPEMEVTVVAGEFFTTVLHRINSDATGVIALDTGSDRFHALTCIDGLVEVVAGEVSVTLQLGRSAVVPASTGAYTLRGAGRVLRSWQTG
jgi:mannose-6-phosphate isomerase